MSFIGPLFTVISSVLAGTIVYVFTKFILDNILEQRKIIYNIGYALIFYADIYAARKVDNGLIKSAVDSFRGLSAKLELTLTIIPLYKFLESFSFITNGKDINEVSKLLMRISNSILPAAGQEYNEYAKQNKEDPSEIIKLLKIK
jgi:hypothetical protein